MRIAAIIVQRVLFTQTKVICEMVIARINVSQNIVHSDFIPMTHIFLIRKNGHFSFLLLLVLVLVHVRIRSFKKREKAPV